MNYSDTILFFSKKYLGFLVTDYGFKIEERNIAFERHIIFKSKRTEIVFLFEITNLTLPLIFYRAYGMNFELKKLDRSQELYKIIAENNERTIPIMEEILTNYKETKEYNQLKWNKEFDEKVKVEIEQFMIEIETLLKNNPKILKGNFLPFLF
ncbi:hypothetical protein [Leeuwenhoekiella sp. W20_SRS_FM14]|uniref:hypothetical protein n=1 Tax=Leeuwenhoekiella sp. W20_SRS_FM14 TaxID=3240270 RepID=UPI003F98063A